MKNLGLSPDLLHQHIAWDIGIEAVTRHLSQALDVPAVYCLYSRLIIDVNRPVDNSELCRAESDGILIPGNVDMSDAEKAARLEAIYHPYHAMADRLVSNVLARAQIPPIAISMHSCAAQMNRGAYRPWQIGISTYESHELLSRFANLLQKENLTVGVHEPYDMRSLPGASLDIHGRQKGLPHLLIEIRQDMISSDEDIFRWVKILRRVFRDIVYAAFCNS